MTSTVQGLVEKFVRAGEQEKLTIVMRCTFYSIVQNISHILSQVFILTLQKSFFSGPKPLSQINISLIK